MATVYLARDIKHDRQVALKVLHPDLAVDLAFAPGFSVTRRAEVLEGDFAPLSRGHAPYDAMPDGRSLLLVKAVSDAQTMVVLNWADELRGAVVKGARRR